LLVAAFAIAVHLPYFLARPFFFGDDFGWLADIENVSRGATGFFERPVWDVWRLGYRGLLLTEYRLFGLRPAPYYAVNLVVHALATLAVAALAGKLGASRGRAALAGALFAAWAAPSLTVRYSTTLHTVVSVLAFLLALYAQRSGRPWPAAAVMLAGATVYEQTLAVVPAAAAINAATRRPLLWGVLPAAAGAFAFLTVNFWTLRGTTRIAAYNPGGLYALRQAILVPLSVVMPGVAVTSGWWVAALLAAVLAAALVWPAARAALPGLLIAWTSVLPLLGRNLTWPEWYLYMASAGVAIALAALAPRSRAWAALCIALVAWNVAAQQPMARDFLRYTRQYEQVTRATTPTPHAPYVVLVNVHSGLGWTAWQFGSSVQSFELWMSSQEGAGCFVGETREEAAAAALRQFPDGRRRMRWPDDMPPGMRSAKAPPRAHLFPWPADGRVPP
jgi:hypothetical protein